MKYISWVFNCKKTLSNFTTAVKKQSADDLIALEQENLLCFLIFLLNLSNMRGRQSTIDVFSPCSHLVWHAIMAHRRTYFSDRLDFTRKCRL